jgi:hypothetical protein
MSTTIYVTKFCPVTKLVLESAKPSGFSSIDQVVMLMGDPIVRGPRTATYRDLFYSEYQLHCKAEPGVKVFFNREA